jgi:UDP-galactopyranose mutase
MLVRDVIVFSHLRWNFVFQRPQHLLSRLARGRRVFFIEEPVRSPHTEWKKYQAENASVYVCTPATPIDGPGFCAEQMPVLQLMMADLKQDSNLRSPALWFYTPMALPLADLFQPTAIVYDCMDELTGFAGAAKELGSFESDLFRRADLVFTGGRSLYQAKRSRNPNVHCFPSSVDLAHYAQARNQDLDHDAQRTLRRPRLGYFGVIDERLDTNVLRALGESHPEWQIAMVGPVVKIDPASLPKLPNIHYFGQRAYQELPKFLAGWDICLLPFALNDATRFISPTKTLEYMAGEKAIVSTPIHDVVDSYSDIVRIADSPDSFVRACEQALREPVSEKERRTAGMRKVLDNTLPAWTLYSSRPRRGRSPHWRPDRGTSSSGRDPPASAPPIISGRTHCCSSGMRESGAGAVRST